MKKTRDESRCRENASVLRLSVSEASTILKTVARARKVHQFVLFSFSDRKPWYTHKHRTDIMPFRDSFFSCGRATPCKAPLRPPLLPSPQHEENLFSAPNPAP